ncbi:hypothetical protein [Novosphingobium gossypii]|uniref:hypothetical protein n=1 Tax=Novosphingobium gossypii TaxID=1604774 RepID=UPI003D1E6D27
MSQTALPEKAGHHDAALLVLGRLDGALRCGLDNAAPIFAAWTLRQMLVGALRREGHEFTDMRFHAWFAGLATLSDLPPRNARAPRAMCGAILVEMAHSAWPALADAARRLRTALLAPLDHGGEDAHRNALAIVSAARTLVAQCQSDRSSSVLETLDRLYTLIGESIDLAPTEPSPASSTIQPAPAPLWAVDMLFAEALHQQGALCLPMPMPMLVRWDAAPSARADALADVGQALFDGLIDARQRHRQCAIAFQGRSTSRAPELFALLAGFGPLRSVQIETMLGASRLGVRGMIASLANAGLVGRTKVGGAILFNAVAAGSNVCERPSTSSSPAFSSAALDEYEASLSAIDRLLDL